MVAFAGATIATDESNSGSMTAPWYSSRNCSRGVSQCSDGSPKHARLDVAHRARLEASGAEQRRVDSVERELHGIVASDEPDAHC